MISKLPYVETSIFTIMSALANEFNAINLSQGFPNFETDKILKNYVKEGLDLEQVQYAPMAGRMDLRYAIALKIQKQHQINVNPESEITITAGATQAIYTIFSTLIHPGDEVILFDPAYDCYDPSIKLHQGIPVHIEMDFPSFSINWDEVRNKINAKTKLIVINNPHNPSGVVFSSEDIKELEKIILENPHVYVLSDEVYEHIQFNGEHQSVLKYPELRKKSFITYSFGKTFHVTGWKLGYLIAPENLTQEFRKIHQFNVFCVNNTMQYAVAKYLEKDIHWQSVQQVYQEKRDLFLNAMKNSPLKALKCEGTYFALFDYSKISNESDLDFTKRLTKEIGVATIPVSAFYQKKTDNKVIRICFAKDNETLLKSVNLLSNL